MIIKYWLYTKYKIEKTVASKMIKTQNVASAFGRTPVATGILFFWLS